MTPLSRIWIQVRRILFLVILTSAFATSSSRADQVVDRETRDTLQAVPMKHGDTLRFRLKNGEQRTFVLKDTSARIEERPTGGIVYSFDVHLLADGQPLQLRRYVCSQETFYEPWVVNGVRLWLSSCASVFDLVPIRYPESHGDFSADALVVFQDAALPIAPEPIRPWFPLERHFIDVGTCYNGDDPWLGPYLGEACHVGLDINMKKGTPLFAPIDFDDQWIFSADHRWRGTRKWPIGDVWALQSHHVNKLLIKERTPLKVGTHYAEAAGKGVGSHPHSHFEFRLGEEALARGRVGGTEIDPWILFWQMFETDRESKGFLHADIEPIGPTETGQEVVFSARPSPPGMGKKPLRYFWTFGDGSSAQGQTPRHVFRRPGVYPVTLIVEDGSDRATRTHHITVQGDAVDRPALVLEAADEVSFRPRPQYAADVYGWPVTHMPHTLRWACPPGTEPLSAQMISIPDSFPGDIEVSTDADWLRLNVKDASDVRQIEVRPIPSDLPTGTHTAIVTVRCRGAINPEQVFRVELVVRPSPVAATVMVDDRDSGFYATPYTWVGHQFIRCRQRGHRQRYLTNGGRVDPNSIVRFTPDLAAGKYEVRLHPESPRSSVTMPFRIRHANGEETVRLSASDTALSLGTYTFTEGVGNFVELRAVDAPGLLIADAVVFRRVQP